MKARFDDGRRRLLKVIVNEFALDTLGILKALRHLMRSAPEFYFHQHPDCPAPSQLAIRATIRILDQVLTEQMILGASAPPATPPHPR